MEFHDKIIKIQRKLKQQYVFKVYYDSQVGELAAQHKLILIDIIINCKKQLYLHKYGVQASIANSDINTGKIQQVNSWTRNKDLLNSQINSLINISTNLLQNKQKFAEILITFLTENPNLSDTVVFSMITSVFGSLSHSYCIADFVELVQEFLKIDQEYGSLFAQPLFAIQCFTKFFRYIIMNCENRSHSVQSEEDAEKFVDEVLEIWKKNRSDCPIYVKQLLNSATDKNLFLMKSFITPFCSSPLSYVSLEFKETIRTSFSLIESAFLKKMPQLIEIILEYENLSEISPLIEDISNRIMIYHRQDIQNLVKLAKIAKSKFDLTIDTTAENVNIANDNEYVIIEINDGSKKNSSGVQKSSKTNLADSIETVLTLFEDIPCTSPEKYVDSFIEGLQSICVQSKIMKRTVMLDTILDIYKDEVKTTKISEVINTIEEKLKEESAIRTNMLDTLRNMKLSQEKISALRKKTQSHLSDSEDNILAIFFSKLVETKAISDLITPQLIEQFCMNSEDFVNFYREQEKSCNEFLSKLGVQGDISILLHDAIMIHIPFEKFLEFHPDLNEQDENLVKLLSVENYVTKVFTGNTPEQTAKALKRVRNLISKPQQLEPAAICFRMALKTNLPIAKLKAIHKSFKKMYYIATYEIDEVGEDDMLPIRLLLTGYVKPLKLVSNIEYIQHFMKPLGEQEDQSKICQLWGVKETLDLIILPGSLNEIQ